MRRLLVLLVLLAGCQKAAKSESAESGLTNAIAKAKDAKFVPGEEVQEAWKKWVDSQELSEFWFVVAYFGASKSWMTLQRDEAEYDVPELGADFMVKREFDKRPPRFDSLARRRSWDRSDPKRIVDADTDKRLLVSFAVSLPEVQYAAVISHGQPKVVSVHKDKSLTQVKLPPDVEDRLNFYLYYLQHAAAGYSWEDMVRHP